jgi:hypothetical protein
VSIVRVGLAETKKFAQGYDAIFGNKPAGSTKKGRTGKKAVALSQLRGAGRKKPRKK